MALEILPSQKRQFIQKIIDNGFLVSDFSFPEERIKQGYQGGYSEFDKSQDYYHIEVYAIDKTNYYRFKKGQLSGDYDVFYAPARGRPDHQIRNKDLGSVVVLFDGWLKVLKGEMEAFAFNTGVRERKTDVSSLQQNESAESNVQEIVEEVVDVPVVISFDQIYEEAIEHNLVRIDSIYDKEAIRYNYNVQFIEWLREKWGKEDIGAEMTFENFKIYLDKGWKYKEGWNDKIKRWSKYLSKPARKVLHMKTNDNVLLNIFIGVIQWLIIAGIAVLIFVKTGVKLNF